MKGLVFTELLEMAEAAVGEEVVDEVLDGLELETGGAYSSVGSYPCSELFAIVGALSEKTGMSGEALQVAFGHWMFDRFVVGYPAFFESKRSALEMLDAIEGEVHVEVRKLYPDAELPRFETEWLGEDALQMDYRSPRPLMAFCRGLVEACVKHFEQPMDIEEHASEQVEGHGARFVIRRAA
ncbi:heme NO-binding domain-containing protein [Pacificoceanicola onchidii]|uniref:heme NO-binding domain-containing protein n=1 Tax=Pacificoceanicola onchidii TaxID=2562685 RepID=UPI0010A34FD0|nr:heme NO-binding domain-containing protein [Pacificoceanicola onchidii]